MKTSSLSPRIMPTLLILFLIAFTAWIAWGYFSVKNVEMLSYTTISKNETYEIRKYDSYIVAETTLPGDEKDPLNKGFTIVADYIFGNNTKNTTIAMTTPVISEEPGSSSETIAMTTPVIQTEGDGFTVAFTMPSKYTLENLPLPNNKEVRLQKREAKTIAVLTFSGFYTQEKIEKRKEELRKALEKDGILITGPLSFAGYNPPWTPPFMTRNEIWAPITLGE